MELNDFMLRLNIDLGNLGNFLENYVNFNGRLLIYYLKVKSLNICFLVI